ncbi:unnamed protein product [Orchesella dallaii]|uniref:Gustatory receptor n=1 Tax=Orchesella dallaii TaxID=48710 RepID=A0ABP1R5A9_9HEXA
MEVTIPGPIKAFNSVFTIGSVFIGIIFFTIMNFSSTQRNLLSLINLLVSPPKSHSLPPSKIAREKERKLIRRKFIDFTTHTLIMIALFSMYFINQLAEFGIKRCILMYWQRISHQPIKHGWAPSDTERKGVRHFREMTWWMKIISCVVIFTDLDSDLTVAATINLFFILTRTLRSFSIHVIVNQITSRKFCVVSCSETLFQYRKLQKIIMLAGRSFNVLTAIFVFTYLVNMCVQVIQMFKDPRWESTIVLLISSIYFGWTLVAAAEIMSDLRRMVQDVNSNVHSGYKNEVSPATVLLQKNILVYEIGSGNLGFGVSDIFTVTYSFIGSIVVALLSNSTIVLQSYDFYERSRPPPPPPPPIED